MFNDWQSRLEQGPITASAPCRIDMGGTLDIKTIYLPLAHLKPATFNVALDLRTRVTLSPYDKGQVKIISRGFESLEFPLEQAPFNHPLGLMFAIAVHFNAGGIKVEIDSASPPRSALGGSSAAAVAFIAALHHALYPSEPLSKIKLSLTAHAIEESVAGVPCGLQDQVAAAYGGVNAWRWQLDTGQNAPFEKQAIFTPEQSLDFEKCFMVAYGGLPHESKDINTKWINHFISAEDRNIWQEIVACAAGFIDALADNDLGRAVSMMQAEVRQRKKMTPEVLDPMGEKLLAAAEAGGCGARFTGAGGGGCVWALGSPEKIALLKSTWQKLLSQKEQACLLESAIDNTGVKIDETE